MQRKLSVFLGILFTFVFVFSLALAVTAEASDEGKWCCYRPPSEGCGATWGEKVWHNGEWRCSCSRFDHPECIHLCGLCW